MNDPYKVLNIPSTATDDEVKHAYRALARKYHPDNYHDNPLADLAQEKMKEINEAYEQIQRQRKLSSGGEQQGSYQGSYTYSGSGDPVMNQIRAAISRGDITQAERLLNAAQDRGAEWNFLMGIVCSRRGWMDDARHYLEAACAMDPANAEYRQALAMLNSSGYRPAGYRANSGTLSFGNDLCTRMCMASMCASVMGGLGCPIFCCF